jgi:hypothetical protein
MGKVSCKVLICKNHMLCASVDVLFELPFASCSLAASGNRQARRQTQHTRTGTRSSVHVVKLNADIFERRPTYCQAAIEPKRYSAPRSFPCHTCQSVSCTHAYCHPALIHPSPIKGGILVGFVRVATVSLAVLKCFLFCVGPGCWLATHILPIWSSTAVRLADLRPEWRPGWHPAG